MTEGIDTRAQIIEALEVNEKIGTFYVVPSQKVDYEKVLNLSFSEYQHIFKILKYGLIICLIILKMIGLVYLIIRFRLYQFVQLCCNVSCIKKLLCCVKCNKKAVTFKEDSNKTQSKIEATESIPLVVREIIIGDQSKDRSLMKQSSAPLFLPSLENLEPSDRDLVIKLKTSPFIKDFNK